VRLDAAPAQVLSDAADAVHIPAGACGASRNFSSIWWESGVARLQAQGRKFWPAYRAAGGRLVDVVLDMEAHIYPDAAGSFKGLLIPATIPNRSAALACRRAQLNAIEADRRWPTVLEELLSRGFGRGLKPSTAGFLAAALLPFAELSRFRSQRNDTDRVIWNAFCPRRPRAVKRH
jgi:hypothetical protein